jgi:hypothetical protein
MTKVERQSMNKRAFDEIIGDPYAKPDPLEGHYAALKCRSSVSVANIDSAGHGTRNAASPNALDFFCDVESAVDDALEVSGFTLSQFTNTYIEEDRSKYILTQTERAEIEQVVGRILVARKISPSSKYFTAIRKGSVEQ